MESSSHHSIFFSVPPFDQYRLLMAKYRNGVMIRRVPFPIWANCPPSKKACSTGSFVCVRNAMARSAPMEEATTIASRSTGSCIFREEQAFLSSLPFLQIDKNIYEKSKRNVLTSGVAACYPFASYEMSDKDGIMIGVNKANSSLVIIDIFNSLKYKNANIAIFGTSGSGKTFLMQLMALRMRQKNIQVFIIAPDKGHEFARACNNIGGEFIQISPSSSNCINIMEIRPTDMETRDLLDGYTSERSELASKIQSLHIFFSLLIPDMSHEEKHSCSTFF